MNCQSPQEEATLHTNFLLFLFNQYKWNILPNSSFYPCFLENIIQQQALFYTTASVYCSYKKKCFLHLENIMFNPLNYFYLYCLRKRHIISLLFYTFQLKSTHLLHIYYIFIATQFEVIAKRQSQINEYFKSIGQGYAIRLLEKNKQKMCILIANLHK